MDYRQTIIADGPLLYYRLNEKTGTTIIDYSASGRNATRIGGTLGVASIINSSSASCWQATAAANQAITQPNPQISFGQFFSEELWLNFNGFTPAAKRHLFGVAGNNKELAQQTNGTITWSIFDSVAGAVNLLQSSILSNSTNYHIVATVDGVNSNLYVNGVLNASQACGPSLVANGNIILGVPGTTSIKGNFQEAAVYNYALSSTQVLTHYNKGVNG